MPTHRRLTIRPEGELVRWSTDGSIFAVQTQNTIDIYSTVSTNMPPPNSQDTLLRPPERIGYGTLTLHYASVPITRHQVL